jgi:hypothetical protein
MNRRFFGILSLSALLLTAFFALSQAEAAMRERQDGAATCGFCNGTGADPEAPWHRFAGRPCRQCGGTGIHQPGGTGRHFVAPADERPAAVVREFG